MVKMENELKNYNYQSFKILYFENLGDHFFAKKSNFHSFVFLSELGCDFVESDAPRI